MSDQTNQKKTALDVFMNTVEKVCNLLPPPTILFCILFLIVAVLGTIFSVAGVELVNPATGDVVAAKNFFTKEGIQWFLSSMLTNFSGFGPLALVLTMTLGIGICEEAGMVTTLLRTAMKNVPANMVPFACAFLGIVMNLASDAAGVLVPPLSAIAYIGVGKHPIAGMICGFAGANVGYAANPIISGTDTLLQGFTNSALEAFIPDSANLIAVDATCNWFIKVASSILCTVIIGIVCTKIIEPRFGKYTGEVEQMEDITNRQKEALGKAGIAFLVMIALYAVGFFSGLLSGPNGEFIGSPLLKGIVPLLFFLFAAMGITYGYAAGTYTCVADIHKGMSKQMAAMGSYVAFCFFCGQFQGLFNWTQLGALSAIGGAGALESIGFTGIPLIIGFIVLVTLVDVFFSSGSAKWAIFAPIFVPMFMLLGYHPAFTQYAYRLGDSAGNMFGPTGATLWMLLSVAQAKYDKTLKIGTFISCNFTIAIILEFVWILMLVGWMLLNLPLGPGIPMHLPAGII